MTVYMVRSGATTSFPTSFPGSLFFSRSRGQEEHRPGNEVGLFRVAALVNEARK